MMYIIKKPKQFKEINWSCIATKHCCSRNHSYTYKLLGTPFVFWHFRLTSILLHLRITLLSSSWLPSEKARSDCQVHKKSFECKILFPSRLHHVPLIWKGKECFRNYVWWVNEVSMWCRWRGILGWSFKTTGLPRVPSGLHGGMI